MKIKPISTGDSREFVDTVKAGNVVREIEVHSISGLIHACKKCCVDAKHRLPSSSVSTETADF